MVLVCFVLDLRNISPYLIGDLKQSFLNLANLHAVSSPVDSLADRIGLSYIQKDRISGNDQLKFAYTPSGNFCLRDFHHAVNSLPTDAFVPEIDESGAVSCGDLKISSVLCDRAMYSWGGRDIMRKVIVLSSCFPEDMDSEARNTLMAAADKCVSVEFLLLDEKASHLSYTQEKTNRFLRCLSDLDNCSFQTCIPDGKSLRGLENKWLQDLKDDTGESLQAQFIFKRNLVGSVNKIVCNLSAATNQIVDGFKPCQTCRCHGIPVRDSVEITAEKLQCSGLCGALYSMDQGLVCSSDCNLDTRKVVEFHCYYILQPSENGPMLLRRLAGSEEVLPISSCVSQFAGSSIPREVEISVKGALLEIESTDYNPLTHNRGFHQKLNLIVKESLQFGSLHSNLDDATCEVSSVVSEPAVPMAQTFPWIINPPIEEETRQEIQITDEEDKATASITKEWEQLVVTEADMKTSMILERLEAPRKMRGKVGSPSAVVTSSQTSPDVSVLSQKKPLIPFQTSQVSNHQTISSSQLMKPSFQRLKRKHK
ncbi:hypothetical protein YC2023_124301 [Brassica napus]